MVFLGGIIQRFLADPPKAEGAHSAPTKHDWEMSLIIFGEFFQIISRNVSDYLKKCIWLFSKKFFRLFGEMFQIIFGEMFQIIFGEMFQIVRRNVPDYPKKCFRLFGEMFQMIFSDKSSLIESCMLRLCVHQIQLWRKDEKEQKEMCVQ